MIQATGFVTAGGRSTRMGQDKALLQLGSRLMIEYVIEALRPVTSSLAIIANSEEYQRFGLPVYADTNTGIGPLEAIRTALANSPSPFVVLVGCDMPFLTAELFSLLLTLANPKNLQPPVPGLLHGQTASPSFKALQGSTPDLPFAVVPLNERGQPEPLCAVYSTEALQTVTSLIAAGVRKASFLFEHLPCRLVSFAEIEHLQNSAFFFENINTPEDFERAVKKK